jgi:predicted MFS family arabinose efflux permease
MFGRARRRLSGRAAFALAYVAAGLGAVTVAVAPGYLCVMTGMAMIGLGVGWFMPNLLVAVGRRVGAAEQSRAAGCVKAENYLSTPLSIMMTDGLAQAHGPRLPILLSAVLAFGLLLAAGFQAAWSRRPRFAGVGG